MLPFLRLSPTKKTFKQGAIPHATDQYNNYVVMFATCGTLTLAPARELPTFAR